MGAAAKQGNGGMVETRVKGGYTTAVLDRLFWLIDAAKLSQVAALFRPSILNQEFCHGEEKGFSA